MPPQTFEAAFAASHEALRAMSRGDSEPTRQLFSTRGDEAPANPLAPPAGGDEVTRLNLRLVTICRREEDGWKRVLRHADRIPIA